MDTEQDRVHRIMQDIAEGNSVGDKLVYDKVTKTLRPANYHEDRDRTIAVVPQDMSVFASGDQETETEEELVRRIMRAFATGEGHTEKIVFHPGRETRRAASDSGGSNLRITVTPEDMIICTAQEKSPQ